MVYTETVGNNIELSLLLEGGEEDLYPQATMYTPSGTSYTYSLTHFDLGRYVGTAPSSDVVDAGLYRVVYIVYSDAAHTTLSDDYWRSEDSYLVSNNDIDAVATLISRILGLVHENIIMDNTSYDNCNQLVSARLRAYNSASNVPISPGGSETSGLVASYHITSSYSNTPGRMRSYRVTKL